MHHSNAPIFWIGGSPCSGKSTIAATLAERYDMALYACDDHVERHTGEAAPETAPMMIHLGRLDTDGLWLRPVGQQVREEITYYAEEFPFIVQDLEMQSQRVSAVIAEGAALMPIVPTPAFQREQYARRAWRHEVLRDCSNPAQGWENWMARDEEFAAYVAAEARRLGYTVITVDGSRSLGQIRAEVEAHFGFGAS
jgi:adenylate kinase family enzyme